MRSLVRGVFVLLALLLVVAPASAQETTATPEATAEATAAATAEATQMAGSNNAQVRVAHFASDAPAVDVYVNGELSSFTNLSFQQVSPWVSLPAGDYDIAIVPTGEAVDAAVLQMTAALPAGTWQTLAAVGSAEAGTLNILTIAEDYGDLLPSTGGITLVHAVEGAPAVNVYRDNAAYTTNLNYPGAVEDAVSSFSIIDDANIHDFQYRLTEDETTVVGDLPQFEIEENAYTLIALVGAADAPEVVTVTTDASVVAMANGTLPAPGTILDAAGADENLTGFLNALDTAGLTEFFAGDTPYTVFAPATFVFDDMTEMPDPQTLARILQYHVVEGRYTARDIVAAGSLPTVSGQPLEITVEGDNIFVNGAQVIAVNIPATNGVIHLINNVLTPPVQ